MSARIVAYILGAVFLAVGLAIGLAIATATARPPAVGGADIPMRQYLDWETRCLPPAAMLECVAALDKHAGYGPPTPATVAALTAAAAEISQRHGVRVTGDALLTMRRMEAALAGARAGVRAQRRGQRLLEMVAEGRPIVEVAAANHLPPLAVLRQVLIELGWAAGDVRHALADSRLLPGNLAGQLSAVTEADLSSAAHSSRVLAGAMEYEKVVGRFLTQKGIKFRTEEQLRGSSQLTPDFLLETPIVVNGSLVYWIDAKNYPMWGSRLVAKSIARQARKYTDAFGPGAFVFSGGVMCGGRIAPADPLLLDGSRLLAPAPLPGLAAGHG